MFQFDVMTSIVASHHAPKQRFSAFSKEQKIANKSETFNFRLTSMAHTTSVLKFLGRSLTTKFPIVNVGIYLNKTLLLMVNILLTCRLKVKSFKSTLILCALSYYEGEVKKHLSRSDFYHIRFPTHLCKPEVD